MQMEAEYRANVNRVYEEVKKRLVGFDVSFVLDSTENNDEFS